MATDAGISPKKNIRASEVITTSFSFLNLEENEDLETATNGNEALDQNHHGNQNGLLDDSACVLDGTLGDDSVLIADDTDDKIKGIKSRTATIGDSQNNENHQDKNNEETSNNKSIPTGSKEGSYEENYGTLTIKVNTQERNAQGSVSEADTSIDSAVPPTPTELRDCGIADTSDSASDVNTSAQNVSIISVPGDNNSGSARSVLNFVSKEDEEVNRALANPAVPYVTTIEVNKGREGGSRSPMGTPDMLRREARSGASSPASARSEDSDDDDDAGIYSETHRHSMWIPSSELETTISENLEKEESPEGNGNTSPGYGPRKHKRMLSTSTTVSETEFRTKYRAFSRKNVQRHQTKTTYQRVSQRYFECDRSVVVHKGEKGFGFHIHGSHPAIVTTVEPGSPADKAGLKVMDVVLCINNVNAMGASHSEIVQMIEAGEDTIRLDVSESNNWIPITDDKPLCTGYLVKQGGQGLLKNWRRRWFVLKQDHCLYYYKTEHEQDPLGAFPLTNYVITKAAEIKKDFAFKATKYGARTYYFVADNEGDMNRWANVLNEAAMATNKHETWLDISTNNVGLPALSIKHPDCHGYLNKQGHRRRNWKRRYCVLKDACLYYYMDKNSPTAQGVAHLHGYTLEESSPGNKKFLFTLLPPEGKMRTFHFHADSDMDKSRWTKALSHSISRWVKAEEELPPLVE